MERITPALLGLIFILFIGFSISTDDEWLVGALPFTEGQIKNLQDFQGEKTSEISLDEQEFAPSQDEATMPDQKMTQPIEKFKVTVKFDQITVHNDHEDFGGGDGEYALSAYVNGRLVDLTKLSKWKDSGLWDVSSGETVRFLPGNFISVATDNTLPLVILTIGEEQDKCPLPNYPVNIQSEFNNIVANETAKALGLENGTKVTGGKSLIGQAGGAGGAALGGYFGGPVGAAIGKELGEYVTEKTYNKIACKVNANEKLGEIEEVYSPPTYNQGTHQVKSSSKDYTLTYTVVVQRLP